MASAAEHLASSISLANFQKATELKKRLWFTLGALILFRLLSFVPVPGIDPAAMAALYQTQSGGILDVFPPTEEHPVRVEFWGDTVEEIAAEKAGIKVGDVIVAVGNQQTSGADAVIAAIRTHQPGDRVAVTIERDGVRKTVNVTLIDAANAQG